VQCPFCGGDSSVTETRDSPDGMRRRRVCGSCKRRFTTYERVGSPGLKVAKRDGSVEPFDSDKLMVALERITARRPGIAPDDLRRVVRDIEATLVDAKSRSVSWSTLVRMVDERLAAIDALSAQRLRVNYVDEDGRMRLEESSGEEPVPQLGLFGGAEPE
jgi:transcriptional repressor NrdR